MEEYITPSRFKINKYQIPITNHCDWKQPLYTKRTVINGNETFNVFTYAHAKAIAHIKTSNGGIEYIDWDFDNKQYFHTTYHTNRVNDFNEGIQLWWSGDPFGVIIEGENE